MGICWTASLNTASSMVPLDEKGSLNMPSESPGSRRRRGRTDKELQITNYDRKLTIFERLGINPQLLSIAAVAALVVVSILLLFSLWQGQQRLKSLRKMQDAQEEMGKSHNSAVAIKDQEIARLNGRVAALSQNEQASTIRRYKADLDARDKDIASLKGQVTALSKKVEVLSKQRCNTQGAGKH